MLPSGVGKEVGLGVVRRRHAEPQRAGARLGKFAVLRNGSGVDGARTNYSEERNRLYNLIFTAQVEMQLISHEVAMPYKGVCL